MLSQTTFILSWYGKGECPSFLLSQGGGVVRIVATTTEFQLLNFANDFRKND
jgi:hypothetical protein